MGQACCAATTVEFLTSLHRGVLLWGKKGDRFGWILLLLSMDEVLTIFDMFAQICTDLDCALFCAAGAAVLVCLSLCHNMPVSCLLSRCILVSLASPSHEPRTSEVSGLSAVWKLRLTGAVKHWDREKLGLGTLKHCLRPFGSSLVNTSMPSCFRFLSQMV